MAQARPIPLATCCLEVDCVLTASPEVCGRAREFLAGLGLPETELDAWEIVLAEAVNNGINYCRSEARFLPLRVELLGSPAWVEVRVTDHTPGFDLSPNAELPEADSESGRGLFLIQQLTDEATYLRGSGSNCLVLRRGHGGTPPPIQPPVAASESDRTLDLMTEELASCYESLAAIFQFSAGLQSGDISGEFLQRWTDQLITSTESDWCVLRVAEAGGKELRLAAASLPAAGANQTTRLATGSLVAGSVEERAVQLRADVWFDPVAPLRADDPLAALAGAGCGFAHPLFAKEALVGVLTIGRLGGALYRAGEASVIQTFGDFLGIQLRSAQMLKEQMLARLNLRELEITADIQRALLPQKLPVMPGATLAGFYRSARMVGGDYYDAWLTPEGNLVMVVADVMGKGLPAALFAFMFRSLWRARGDLARRPGELLAWLNQNLYQELEQAGMFITCQTAFLDCSSGILQVSSAGHPPMLLVQSAGGLREITAGGPPLGVIEDALYPEESASCLGSRALMFTDGLFEACNPDGDQLGFEALETAFAAAARQGSTGEEIRDTLAGVLERFEHGAAPADDTAFLVLCGAAEPAR